ncbi:C45 family autoproteolytic acyltransferase/hydrolase [Streptomyces sp. NPDC004111]|uniref:C45 family autoproteolytic acyltransferase/hydolase n=1 Tax=Streptomyces sp. NPDC004111 TaxID=3364690 RepID=UPI0036CBD72A
MTAIPPSGQDARPADAAPYARPATRLRVSVDDADPRRRGRARGQRLADGLPGALDAYDRLFALAEIPQETVREDAERALDAVGAFRPGLREQIEGIAEGAGIDTWRIGALNARTEILARSRAVPPGECSTLVRRLRTADGGSTHVGVQTWDWHVELSSSWHTVDSAGGAHRYTGITEHGILAKIGVNSAGLALHFNILGHRDDRIGGIPVHVLAALVLEEAESTAHAREILNEAPLTSSGSFTLFDEHSALLLDLSPEGIFEVPEVAEGTHLRTNHFLTATPAAHEKTWLYQPDSGERYDFLRERIAREPVERADELIERLVTGAGEPPVTCVPDLGAAPGQRWASLATVVLDPAARTARVLDGTPAERTTRPWVTLRSA